MAGMSRDVKTKMFGSTLLSLFPIVFPPCGRKTLFCHRKLIPPDFEQGPRPWDSYLQLIRTFHLGIWSCPVLLQAQTPRVKNCTLSAVAALDGSQIKTESLSIHLAIHPTAQILPVCPLQGHSEYECRKQGAEEQMTCLG